MGDLMIFIVAPRAGAWIETLEACQVVPLSKQVAEFFIMPNNYII